MGVAVPQLSESCARQTVQSPPQDFVDQAANIDPDSSGARFDSDDVNGFGRKGVLGPGDFLAPKVWPFSHDNH